MSKIAIIGAGAAGLFAAITARKRGLDVTLIEKNSKVGKKILASGNGRCNITNTDATSENYASENPNFVSYALKTFGFDDFEKFCQNMGLFLDIKDDGRVYPLSNEAKSVVISFENYASNLGVKILCDTTIKSVSKDTNSFILLDENDQKLTFDKLLITTGLAAAPQLGSCEDGLNFAKVFKHTVHPTYASLVQLELEGNIYSKLSGVKQQAKVSLRINGDLDKISEGDILFTKYGISGFAILDISQRAAHALLNYARTEISLDLLPRYDKQSLSNKIIQMCKNIPQANMVNLLSGLIPIKLALQVLRSARIDESSSGQDLNTKESKKIAHLLKDWRFEVSQTHGLKHAEVSGGGVDTLEVDDKTMESKLQSGLYFAGEVLDVVGDRGGYNFRFAFSSAYLAGTNI